MRAYSAMNKLALVTWLLASATATAVVRAQVPGGCNTPVSERTSEIGCYLSATEVLGPLPQGPLFWHLYVYPTRAAAETAKGPRGTVVESLGRSGSTQSPSRNGARQVASALRAIGPLPISAGKQYTARYMEAVFTPGMKARIHRHSGPEAWYLVSGVAMLGDARRYHGCAHRRGGCRAGGTAHGPLERGYGDTAIRPTRPSRHVATLDHDGERLEAEGPVSEMSLRQREGGQSNLSSPTLR